MSSSEITRIIEERTKELAVLRERQANRSLSMSRLTPIPGTPARSGGLVATAINGPAATSASGGESYSPSPLNENKSNFSVGLSSMPLRMEELYGHEKRAMAAHAIQKWPSSSPTPEPRHYAVGRSFPACELRPRILVLPLLRSFISCVANQTFVRRCRTLSI